MELPAGVDLNTNSLLTITLFFLNKLHTYSLYLAMFKVGRLCDTFIVVHTTPNITVADVPGSDEETAKVGSEPPVPESEDTNNTNNGHLEDDEETEALPLIAAPSSTTKQHSLAPSKLTTTVTTVIKPTQNGRPVTGRSTKRRVKGGAKIKSTAGRRKTKVMSNDLPSSAESEESDGEK